MRSKAWRQHGTQQALAQITQTDKVVVNGRTQNTSGESAAASGEDLDPASVRDGAHVRERAFSDVSDRLPNGAAPMGSYRVAASRRL